jgi:hypothetical protein
MRRRVDQRSADPAPPQIGLDEQAVEFAPNHGCESGNATVELCHEHLPIRDLGRREVDGARIGLKLFAILRQGERRASLERFESFALVRLSETDREPLNGL